MAMTPTLGVGFMTKIVRRDGGFSAEIVTSIAIYSCTSVRNAKKPANPGSGAGLSASEIAKVMEIGSRIERSARGEPGADSDARLSSFLDNAEDEARHQLVSLRWKLTHRKAC
jgi:hypothetical protein